MVKYCQLCNFPLQNGFCPKHGHLAGPVEVQRSEVTQREDREAEEKRSRRSGSGPDPDSGSFHPDMTKLKARRKFQQAMKHQQPMVVNLDRDLQEQYLQKAVEAAGFSMPSRPSMALEEGGNFCGGCGFLQEDDDNFCPKCGRPRRRGNGTTSFTGGNGSGGDGGENLFSQT